MLQLQVNHLEVELARRDKEREIIEHNQVTQRKLESKVADLMLLLKEINKPSTGSPCTPHNSSPARSSPLTGMSGKHSNLSDADDSPFLEPRLMRSYNSDEETEGYLPCIEEETQSRKLGSGGDRRKSSFKHASSHSTISLQLRTNTYPITVSPA